MIILGIDPGDSETGFCFYRKEDGPPNASRILARGKVENKKLLILLTNNASKISKIYIEDVAQYGNIVGKHVFDTIKMIGRIMERCDNNNIKFELVFRKTIVAYHTDNPKANDTIMKSWFINNFGEIGRKGKNQGPFFGIKSDEISAIAIAAYGSDMEILNDKKSKTSQHPES